MTAPTPVTVAGVDGCRGAWAVATAVFEGADRAEPTTLAIELVDDLAPLIAEVRTGAVAAMAIDMPIGLLEDRPRPCDIEARKVLGPRRSTVFPAPVRATLAAVDYDDACRLSRAASGKALSKQTYNLLAAIRRLDELVEPDDAETIVEAHPECAFARLAGAPLDSKHEAAGRAERHRLLATALGDPFAALDRGEVPPIDLLDATVLTITARHVVAGTAIRLGGDVDTTGRRAQVVY